ncbi:MAG TPA: NAD(P)H-dependent oxidoreductase [Cyclobacteriaceae bacterium]|nr:NAD(P)H-dependent oxidoreductase [Cyclobacteriaceae bacterium]
MNRKKVLAICGSTRKNSTNESILKGMADMRKDRIDINIFNQIDTLPHFNPEIEPGDVEVVARFLKLIEDADGVLFCTPEYVFSLPGSLKNAIEWTIPTTVLLNKPVAVIVASGLGEKAFESLILIMNTVGATMPTESTLLIQGLRNKFDASGIPLAEDLKRSMKKLMESFEGTMK